jgi:hypothetical protein
MVSSASPRCPPIHASVLSFWRVVYAVGEEVPVVVCTPQWTQGRAQCLDKLTSMKKTWWDVFY